MKRIPVTEVPDQLEDDTILMDVREADEWALGHAPQATHVPLSRIDQAPLDPSKTYLTLCRSGNRSYQVAMAMERAGFTVADVDGGMAAWARAGKPMVSDLDREPVVA